MLPSESASEHQLPPVKGSSKKAKEVNTEKQILKILQFGKFYPPHWGGIERVIYNFTEEFNQRDDVQCDVLCASDDSRTYDEKVNSYRIVRTGKKGLVSGTAISPAMIFWLHKLGNQYDIIHLHHPDPMATLALFFVRPKAKLIIHWHSDIIKQKYLYQFFRFFEKAMLKRADKIIATSEPYLENSLALRPFREKAVVIPIGIEPDRLCAIDEEVEKIRIVAKGRKIIFSLGRMTDYKGFQILLHAMVNTDSDSVLILGGEGTETSRQLSAIVQKYFLEDRVIFSGRMNEDFLGSYYAAADIFVLPSLHKNEAFGLVQVEAMSFGVPVISTRIPGSGVSWVNQDNLTGFTVDPGNSIELAAAINRLLRNEKIRREYGKNGQERVKELFTVEKTVGEVLELYESLMAIKE